MDTTTFIDALQETGRFESEEDTHGTITATLETMSGCIARGQAEDIADELPANLAEALLADETEAARPVEYEEFLSRVSDAADFDTEYAQPRVQAVFDALERAVDEFEYENLREQLPAEYSPLFEAVRGALADRDGRRRNGPRYGDGQVGGVIDSQDAGRAPDARRGGRPRRTPLGGGEHLVDRPRRPRCGRVPPEEFVDRVADRAGVNTDTARDHVRRVIDGLDSFVDDEMQRPRDQLGPDYASLV